MSRIGKKPISVPAGVTVTCENNHVTVKGPKGEIAKQFSPELGIAVEDGVITVTRPTDDKEHRSLHGLTRTLIANMIEGVTNGYSKTLIIEGVGYRAAKKGKEVVLSVGFSHPVNVPETDDIKLDVPQPNTMDSMQQKSVKSVRRNRIRARAFAMKMNISSARKVKPARAKSN